MSKSAVWSIVVSAAILIGLIFVVPRLLSSPEPVAHSEVAARPACPTGKVGSVTLPCLGADAATATPKPTVVNVWAWWCQPCRAELPLFDALAAKHPEWTVTGVHADTNAANGAALLNDLGIQLPSLQDNSNAFAGTYALPSVVPMTVVFNERGELVKSYPVVFPSEEELEKAVTEALRS